MRFFSASILSIVIGLSAMTDAAGSTTLTFSYSIPSTPTNLMSPLPIQKFDPSLGALESVAISLWGRVDGQVRFESFNATPRQVSYSLSATIELRDELNHPLADSLPVFANSETVDAFDGVFDFGGLSGRTYSSLSAQVSAPLSKFFDQATLDRFTGAGDLNFQVNGTGTSQGTGPGNIVWDIQTLAAAWVQVEYSYEQAPEPACVMMLALAAVMCRNRQKAVRRARSGVTSL